MRLLRAYRIAPIVILYLIYAVVWLVISLLARDQSLHLLFFTPLLELVGCCVLIGGALYIGYLIGRQRDPASSITPDAAHLSAVSTMEANYHTLQTAFERQTRESALLDRVRIAISRELDLQTIIRTVVEGVAETFGYTQISLYLLEGHELVLQYQIGYDKVIERIPITKGISGRVITSGEPLLIEDVSSEPEFLGAISGIVSEIAVPLFEQHKVVGLFNVESINGIKLTNADLALMIALSDHIDIALNRARLYEDIRRNEETFRQLFHHAPIAMVLSNMTAQVVRVNPATCELLGYSESELLGMNLSAVAYPEDDPKNIALRDELIQGKMTYFTMEKRYIAQSGKLIYGILQVALIRDAHGNPSQFVGQIVDVTDLKEAERKLQSLNLMLEQRVNERTRELSSANQRLIELDKLKTKFIGDISHELRTPVANINTRLYLIDHDKTARAADHLAVIKAQMGRLQLLLDDVLNFARLEAVEKETLFLEPININTLIETLKPTFLARANAAKLTLQYELQSDPLMIHGSDELIVKLFTNLLDNAIKYTHTGHIQVRTHEVASKQRAVIEVSDSGHGILPEDLPHIFERFYRGHDVGSLTIPGAGLGLAIVKEIVALHHGEVEVESIPSQGTTFRIFLPLVNELSAL